MPKTPQGPWGTVRSVAKARRAHRENIARAEALKGNDKEFGRFVRTTLKQSHNDLLREETSRRTRAKWLRGKGE